MKKLFVFAIAGLWLTTAAMAGEGTAKDKTVQIDAQNSKVVWNAKKVTGTHHGTVPVNSGSIIVDGNKIKGGTVVIDMKSLKVEDVKDAEMNGKLTNHLKSDDFFSVEKFPQAKLVITSVAPKSGSEYTVSGDLTIKGITKPVSFPATITTDGKKLTAVSKVAIDRTKYDIKFRSSNFFENLGDKAIMDEFTLDVNVVANL